MPGIDECLLEAMALPGARGAALVDWSSGLALGTAGDSPVGDHETTAAETAELARAAAEYESFAQPTAELAADDPGGPPVEDVIVTTRTGYHVLRFVETSFDSSVFLHLWLDRTDGNLALARHRLRALAEGLVLR
ncbi:roadblock/LC7 domain-containing protein [Streptomyces sp. NPDC032472]|uniref:roadblock/LC7 domain-containing protein n=1 Tax=Streptomyces sp. NPDC032472 TaxID=3155018 RepID=UPI0033FD7C38